MEANPACNSLVRILRLWKVYAHLDFLWMTRDLKYFLVCYVSEAFITVAAVTSMILLTERFNGIGHWSKWQVVFMLGYGSALRGLLDFFFSYNVLHISRRIGRGQLDHTLIQPQPVWVTLFTEGFAPFQSTCTLLPGVGLMIWSLSRMSLHANPAWLVALLVNMAASCAVLLSFSFIWGSMAFWAPRAAEEISTYAVDLIDHLKLFPLGGLGPVLLGSLMTALPVGFLAWYPCLALLGIGGRAWGVFTTPFFATALAVIAAVVFRKGMAYYGRTGPQRYSAWGHRR